MANSLHLFPYFVRDPETEKAFSNRTSLTSFSFFNGMNVPDLEALGELKL